MTCSSATALIYRFPVSGCPAVGCIGTIDLYRVVANPCGGSAGTVGAAFQTPYGRCPAGFTAEVAGGGTTVIPVVIVDIGVVDDGGPVVNRRAVAVVVTMHVAVVHISVGQEGPVAGRQVDVDVYVDAGAHGCPSVVSTTTSPANPGWCPFVTGNPCPSVVVVIVPSSVVERCPSPGVVGDPGVAVVGHHPISVGSIWMEVTSHVGDPYPAMCSVVDPTAVRAQLIVEEIEADPSIVVVVILVIGNITIVIVVVVSSLCICATASVAGSKHQDDGCEDEVGF